MTLTLACLPLTQPGTKSSAQGGGGVEGDTLKLAKVRTGVGYQAVFSLVWGRHWEENSGWSQPGVGGAGAVGLGGGSLVFSQERGD